MSDWWPVPQKHALNLSNSIQLCILNVLKVMHPSSKNHCLFDHLATWYERYLLVLKFPKTTSKETKVRDIMTPHTLPRASNP
jgi:hypothetical protein